MIVEYLPLAVIHDQSDILTLEKDDPYWNDLKPVVAIESLASTQKLQKATRRTTRIMALAFSAFSREAQHTTPVTKSLSVSLGTLFGLFLSRKVERATKNFFSMVIMIIEIT